MRLVSILVLSAALSSCTGKSDGYDRYRQAAWDYLSDSVRATVIGTVRDGKYTADTVYPRSKAPSFTITWETRDGPLVGPLVVHFDKATETILGIEPRF